jgi:hypothetical protein
MKRTDIIELKGQPLPYAVVDGLTYLPLKPICELFQVDYERQRKQIRLHAFLNQFIREVQLPIEGAKPVKKTDKGVAAPSLEAVQLPQKDGKRVAAPAYFQLRKMLCLPEDLIYGWMMELPSTNDAGRAYKWECYWVLRQRFHQSESGLMRLIMQEDAELAYQEQKVENELAQDPRFQELRRIRNDRRKLRHTAAGMQRKVANQLLFEYAQSPEDHFGYRRVAN